MKNFGQTIRRRFCSHIKPRGHRETGLSSDAYSVNQVSPENDSDGGAQSLHFGLPLDEDLKAGSFSKTIRYQWANVPPQVRRVMDESTSTSASSRSFLVGSDEPVSPWVCRAKSLLLNFGRGSADLTVQRKEYCTSLALVPYEKGMKSAYHWPRVLIPRSVAARCRGDLRVDPIDADRSVLLLDHVLDKTSVIFCFSGYDLSGPNTGVKAWKSLLSNIYKVNVIHIHMSEGWLSRRTHPLTRQILRSFRSEGIEPQKQEKTFIYKGNMNHELLLDFHLYNKSLPSILLVDSKGYIRWHAVGLPTEESGATMVALLQKLIREK